MEKEDLPELLSQEFLNFKHRLSSDPEKEGTPEGHQRVRHCEAFTCMCDL